MKHAKAVRRIIFTVLIVAAVIVGFNTYTADYYHAKDYELQTTEVSETDAYIAYGDPQSETGLIFYPGAKVEETAYAPVMDGLAQRFEYGKISGSNRSCGGLPRVCLRGRQPCRVRQLRIAEGRRRGRDYGQGAVAGNDRLHHGHDPAATGGKVAEPGE